MGAVPASHRRQVLPSTPRCPAQPVPGEAEELTDHAQLGVGHRLVDLAGHGCTVLTVLRVDAHLGASLVRRWLTVEAGTPVAAAIDRCEAPVPTNRRPMRAHSPRVLVLAS